MQKEMIAIRLNELFQLNIPTENLDSSECIEDTKIYTFIRELVIPYKPNFSSIEINAFEFAIKTVAIEFFRSNNHGFYCASSYMHLFEDKYKDMKEDILLFLSFYGFLKGFDKENVRINYEKSTVESKTTEEVLTFDTLDRLGHKWLEYEITIQMDKIKTILNKDENKNALIKLIAGSEKENQLESASCLFEELI